MDGVPPFAPGSHAEVGLNDAIGPADGDSVASDDGQYEADR